jgi:GAF domain-containing protein
VPERPDLDQAAGEQAALRRVATLVAQETPEPEVFAAIAEEVAHLMGTEEIRMLRSNGEELTVVGRWGTREAYPLGSRHSVDRNAVSSRVLESGHPFRVDDYAEAGLPESELAGSLGIQSVLGAPITVAGRLWGVFTAWSTADRPLPPDAEERLETFAELMGAAIANAEARSELRRVAEEQAALRRVATLVAKGAVPAELFAAVADEVAAVLGVSSASVSRFLPGGESIVLASLNDPGFPVGSRWSPDEGTLNAAILETALPVRIDQSGLTGAIAEASRVSDVGSVVGVPIIVEGGVWGMIAVGRQGSDEPLPAYTEVRLTDFTELVATAISNAEARDGERTLGEEQAALRRVATLVARDAPSNQVFEAVAIEVGKLFGTDITLVGRYDADGGATAIGNWTASGRGVPVGTRTALGGNNVLTMVAETGKPARVDWYDDASGEAADIARRFGWRASIAAPIVVEGRTWGAMLIATERPRPFPPGAEERLALFTDLVATAVGNAQAHEELRRFADEQAALGRVATLVADGGAPEQVFEGVVREVSALLGLERIELVRYDGEAMGTVVAATGDHPFPAGSTWSLEDPSVMATVAGTGRAARIDDYSALTGGVADAARHGGFRSAIGTPITVEGRLWGVIIAISTDPEPIPERSEARLAQFTELVATAVSNAQALGQVERLAEEQAALRRVATLVAEEEPPEDFFARVVEETGRLLGGVQCTLVRLDPDGAATNVGNWGVTTSEIFPLGERFVPDGDGVAATVLRTAQPHRIDDYSVVPDPVATGASDRGVESAVGCPIVVRGALWGALLVGTTGAAGFPADTELRLAQFAELVATAVANAEARAEILRLSDARGALRRVATLVAHGAEPAAIFSAITDEVKPLFETDLAVVVRFEEEPHAFRCLAVTTDFEGVQVGGYWPLAEEYGPSEPFRSGLARRDDGRLRRRYPELGKALDRLGLVSTVGTPIIVDGRLWGALIVSNRTELPPETEDRLLTFTELAGTAVANAQARSDLASSRRRIVTASDEARRQIERNLHDGTQQRLVSLGLAVRAAEAGLLPEQNELHDQLSRVALGLADAVEDLQEISRGIHPAILSRGGLGAALRGLAIRSPIPVHMDVSTTVRLAEPVEVAGYYVVSEALANAAKHSQATRIEVTLRKRRGRVVLRVRDDGVGGADPGRGSGLVGLADRVEALGGSISVDSRAGAGTEIRAELPVEFD